MVCPCQRVCHLQKRVQGILKAACRWRKEYFQFALGLLETFMKEKEDSVS